MLEENQTEKPAVRHEPRFKLILKDIVQVLAVLIGIVLLLTFVIPGIFQLFGLKILGIILILFGIFLVKEFPDIGKYQSEFWSWTGIKLGFIFIIIGIILFFV